MNRVMKSIKLYELSFFFVCIFILDSVFHLGRLLSGNEMDYLRYILFASVLGSTFILLCTKKKVIINQFSVCVIIYILLLFLSYVRAVFIKQDLDIANEFLKGYVYFIFLPCLLFSVKTKKQLYILIKLLVFLGTTLSLLSFLLLFAAIRKPSLHSVLMDFVRYFDLMNMMYQDGNTLRIMFSGILLQIIAFFLSLCFYIDKGKLFNFILLVINFIGIFLTYSRGIIAGVVLASIFVLMNYSKVSKNSRKRIIKILIISLLMILLSLIILLKQDSDIINFFINRFFHNNETESNNIRLEMTYMLKDLMYKHIFIGNGAGAHILLRDGRVEMVFHDIVSKVGIIGLLCFLYPFFSMIYYQIHGTKNSKFSLSSLKLCSLAALFAIMVASYSNPYLVTSFGLLIYCLCMCIFTWTKPNEGVL